MEKSPARALVESQDRSFDGNRGRPAAFGGEPLFEKMLPIIKPTLFDPEGIFAGLGEIFLSGRVTNSRFVERFEEECARFLGVRHAVAVSSATSGLMLAVKGLGLKGEVIVPSFTFTATAHALVWNNIKPVFVDCEEKTYNIDVTKIEEKLTQRTSAIMPVYIFGAPPRIEELQDIAGRNHLKLIFDSAQAFGSEYRGVKAGGFGDCEVFSLSPTKVLTAVEGGLITTQSDPLAEFLRRARDYGKSQDGGDVDHIGLSARMSEVHALIGLKNLKNVETCLKRRRELIGLYKSLLSPVKGLSFQEVPRTDKSSGNYMVIFVDEGRFGMSRDGLFDALRAENIQTKKYFYPAVHMQKAYLSERPGGEDALPVTERAARQGLALPLYGHIGEDAVRRVSWAVRRIHNHAQAL